MTNLPASADRANAPLPERYEAAKVALKECHRIDECKDWADKAKALASYARQADDDTLYKTAMRIQARAIRRSGELLQEFQTGSKGGRPRKNGGGTHPVSQRGAAEQAGMSKEQEKTARRVAEISEDEFEAAIESEDPPTITTLTRPTGPGFVKARHLVGDLGRFYEFCQAEDPGHVASGLMEEQIEEIRDQAVVVRAWLDDLIAQAALQRLPLSESDD